MAKAKTKREDMEDFVAPEVRKLLSKEIGFDSSSLLASIVEHWGGPQALAASLYQDYRAAKPGTMTRQRIIELISRLTVQVTNHGMAQAKDPSNLSDEELLEEAELILKAVSDRKSKRGSKEEIDPDERPDA